MVIELPKQVRQIIITLQEHGYEAYAVGGCVRDTMLGRTPQDWDITTSALSEADKKMLEGILPYPSEALQEFSMPYLSGFQAKKRDIERDQLSEEVRRRMHDYAAQLLRGTVHGYSSVNVQETEVNVRQSHWEYSLMPIWILNYKGRDGKTYTYAMNGHTGKVYGELPISFAKLGALLAAIALPLTALFTWIGGMLF